MGYSRGNRNLTQVTVAPIILLILIVAACGGLATPTGSAPPPATQADHPVLLLPAPSDLARQASLTDRDRVCLGSEFDAPLPLQRVTASGNFAGFDAAYAAGGALDGLAFATYAFKLTGFEGTTLAMSWDAAPPAGSLWLALSNYVSGRWDWFSLTPDAPFDVASVAPYIDPDSGSLFAVVLVAGDFQGQLKWIRWGGNVPPTAALAADPASGDVPLSVTFDASASLDPDGTLMKYEWDWNGDNVYDATSYQPAIEHLYTSGGNYMAKVRVTDDAGATAIGTVHMIIFAQKAMDPVAVLIADPASGSPPLTVNLDAAGSYDDQPLLLYEWDFDGDGVFSEADNGEMAAKNSATAQYIYTALGVYAPSVRVTDEDFNTATASATVTVEYHGWYVITIDHLGSSGKYNSVAIIDGNPAIAYQRWSCGLCYIRANNADGTSWPEYSAETDGQVDSYGGAGKWTSLKEVDGAPAISYLADYWEDHEIAEIRYVRAADADGSAWGAPAVIDTSSTGTGGYTSLAVVDGNPAIAYFRVSGGASLCYTRAADTAGSLWPTPSVVYAANGAQGQAANLLVVDGNPAIGFRYDAAIMYIRATDADGSAWGTAVSLSGFVGYAGAGCQARMAIVDGNPALAYANYYHMDNDSLLYYCRATDPDGATWGTPLLLASTGANLWPSLSTMDGVPAISYIEGMTGSALKLYKGSDADGGSFLEPETVTGNPGVDSGYTTLLTINGRTAVVYYKGVLPGRDLMIAIYFP